MGCCRLAAGRSGAARYSCCDWSVVQQVAAQGDGSRRVHIITDSASDLGKGEIPGVDEIIPLTISFGDDVFEDGVNLTHQQFYEKLVESDELPRTSQATPFAFAQVYEQHLGKPEDGGTDEAVVITLSAKLSGTYESALAAARPWGARVHVVDSTNVTVGEKALVAYAARLVEQGLSAAQIAAKLDEEKSRIRLVALLDTLEYLQKGGRISKTVAIAGGMLSIKPVVAIQDGLVAMLGKARGSKRGNNLLIQQVQEAGGIDFAMPFYLGYTGLGDELIKKYIEDSRCIWADNVEEVGYASVGGTIGTHVGPGAIALAFFAKEY